MQKLDYEKSECDFNRATGKTKTAIEKQAQRISDSLSATWLAANEYTQHESIKNDWK